jgi:hypothetical protein
MYPLPNGKLNVFSLADFQPGAARRIDLDEFVPL